MSEASAKTNTPPRDEPGRGFVFLGCAILSIGGLLYVPFGFAMGSVLGTEFALDPTWPRLLGLPGNGFVALVFTAAGAMFALASLGSAGAVITRWPYAPVACGAVGCVALFTANLPLTVVAFALAYSAMPQPVAVGAAPAAG